MFSLIVFTTSSKKANQTTMASNFKINYTDFLTEDECLDVHSVIYELKKFWQYRDNTYTYSTLGSPSSCDAHHYGFSSYCAKANLFNPILYKHFGWLYQKLSETLTLELDEPVCYQQKFSLPGFHIFTEPKVNLNPILGYYALSPEELDRDRAHTDQQHKLLDWTFLGEINSCKSFSFTVAIALPESGGGLDVWNLSSEEVVGLSNTEVHQLLCSRERFFFPYQAGQLVFHSGLFYHQVPLRHSLQDGDERITLQGHGLFSQGMWHLYW
jgi:hypothetical protein